MPPRKKKTSQLASKTTTTSTPVVPIPAVHAPVVPAPVVPAPVVSTPVVPAPVAALTAAAPTAATVNTNILRNPRRDHQLPIRQDPTTHSNICKACEKIHDLDDTYHVASYVHDTSTSTRRTHAFTEHTDIYLEEAERQRWHVLHKLSQLKTFLDEGWTIATMCQRLRDPDCTLDSLGTPPSPDLLPGTSL
ncbi:hypothetical protein BDR06DRAFT_976865 [Suillus hirtellus]|nr:hypothetical protein BDR06DRAFT_976865 [Suillus hirtellus]